MITGFTLLALLSELLSVTVLPLLLRLSLELTAAAAVSLAKAAKQSSFRLAKKSASAVEVGLRAANSACLHSSGGHLQRVKSAHLRKKSPFLCCSAIQQQQQQQHISAKVSKATAAVHAVLSAVSCGAYANTISRLTENI
jgi:hypothetical protein